MDRTHEEVIEAQFGSRGLAYVESAVHGQGGDLDALEHIVRKAAPAHALDLGAGGGHVSYLMARHARRVTAADLSAGMLAAVAATARQKGLGNIETRQAPAERLPFADGEYDFLACRFSAHHWRDFDGGLREASRVLRRGAPAVFIDVCSPGPAPLDTHLQAVELLRDTSHARDYSLPEWGAALGRAGFTIGACRTWRLRMEFADWIARMRTPDDHARAIRALQTAASAEVRAHYEIEADGSFTLDVLLVDARNG